MSNTSNVTNYQQFIERYYDDPVLFVREVLGKEPLSWQTEFLNKLASGSRRLTIRAGHGVGKSTACGWALLWHMLTRFPQKSVITAPAEKTLLHGIFADLKALINNLPPFLGNLLEHNMTEIRMKAAPQESFIAAKTSSASTPEALAGIHSEHVLIIVDEASGVDEAVYNAAGGSMSTEGSVTVLIGNPTRNSGYFYNTHQGTTWEKMHVSCTTVPELVDENYIKDMAEQHGEDSNEYRIRVLGEFPLSDENTLIPAFHVDAAFERDIQGAPTGNLIYGVDPARFGPDRSVLVKRRGDVVEEILVWKGLDNVQLAGAIAAEARLDRPSEICVDVIGIGSGVRDILHHQGEFNIIGVNVAEASAFNPQANRLRDDLWLQCRDWLKSGNAKLPKDHKVAKELREELVAVSYTYSGTGKIIIESKDQMRRRMRRSPDIADALCLTFAGSAAMYLGTTSKWVKGQPLRRGLKGVV